MPNFAFEFSGRIWFQDRLSLGQEEGWFLPRISAGGQRHLEGTSGICKGKEEIRQRCCMSQSMAAKKSIPANTESFQRSWKKKILLSVLTRPKSLLKMEFPAILFSDRQLY